MAHKMNETEYLAVLNSLEKKAIDYNEQITIENAELLKRYKGEPYGDEQPERSKVISNDVQDVIEADMPSLARNFLGARKPCIFKPNNDEDIQDVSEAKEKTEYIDWLVRRQKDSFRIQHAFLKDIAIQKVGAIKYGMEETVSKKRRTFEGITYEQIPGIEKQLKEQFDTVEMVDDPEIDDDGLLYVVFEGTKKIKQTKIIGVPLESLLITPNASCEDEAALVGDRSTKTRGELLQEGFKMDVIKSLPCAPQNKQGSMESVRFDADGNPENFGDWANQEVEICEIYPKIDKDGDGIAERRRILKSGDVIIEDEPFDIVPYAITSAILMSHNIVGMSRAEITAPTAQIKTALIRGILDNSYAHNAPQIGINDNVFEDDLLVKRPNGIVRVEGDGNPGQSIFPMNVEYIGDKALQVTQYFDQARAQTTGSLLASQGLTSDQFEKETATRFNGVLDEGKAKIELVIRVIAETAYKRMYEGLEWLVREYQATETDIHVGGKPTKINPAKWRYDHAAESTLGLGSGDGEQTTETLAGLLNLQLSMYEQGNPLVDLVKIFNTIDAMLKSMDMHNTIDYFNDPEQPTQLVQAENEILKKKLMEFQEVLQGQGNPLAEAEQVKGQVTLLRDQLNMQKEAMKMNQDNEQFMAKLAADKEENDKQLALKLTELEAKFNQELDAKLAENTGVFDPESGSIQWQQ